MKIYFPAEWHPQDIVQLTWPHIDTDFKTVYEQTIQCFTVIALEISKRQKLIIVCKNIEQVKHDLGSISLDNIHFFETDTNDVWARDHGGITVFDDNNPVIYDFCFNGWGKKFPAEKDNKITKKLCNSGFFSKAIRKDLSHFVFEGGSIESNGYGVLLTTEECLLSKFRNPHITKSKIELYIKDIFGAHTVLWLKNGFLQGDDTDSHIDTLARFIADDTIMYVQCKDENDLHYNSLLEMEKELQAFKDYNDEPYKLIPIPMASAIFDNDERLPATYANFLFINNAILLPIYHCETDSIAIEIFKNTFPNKEIVPIDCSVLITQHGSLHCVTMQYPKGVL
jgi:agmatine deiminase